MEDQLPRRGSGINLLCETYERDVALAQPLEQFHQMLERASCTIQLPHHECISRSQVRQSLIQTFALCLRPGNLIEEPFLAACFSERVNLQCLMLLLLGDPDIADFHTSTSICLTFAVNRS